jgi:predicted RNA-binding protein with PUA-like domain
MKKKASGSAPYEQGKWAAAFAPRKGGEKRYWLVKSEPGVFSFDDLMRAKDRTTQWDGVRNSAARNFLRDGMKVGDGVFFYHSSTDPQAIVGVAEVSREGYPDPTALDQKHAGTDPASSAEAPTWYAVDIRGVGPLARPVTLAQIKARPELAGMALVRIGRLSVTPVTESEWNTIKAMGS